MTRPGASFRTRVTRLRLLRRGGWGQFRAETVTLVDLDLAGEQSEIQFEVNDIREVNDILDLDDEDAETGLPYGRERTN